MTNTNIQLINRANKLRNKMRPTKQIRNMRPTTKQIRNRPEFLYEIDLQKYE